VSGNLTDIRHSLNAGEVSQRIVARQDQNKYLAGCETLLNWQPLITGGATLCPGSQFVTATKIIAGHPISIMRPFVASRQAAYTMEIGHLYVRFFFNGLPVMDGPDPLELETPYQDQHLAELFLVQSIDVCYLLHGLYFPRKITRISDTEFTIGAVPFNPPATQEDEPTGADLLMGTLTPASTTGSNVAFNSGSGGFLAADVGRIIVADAGRALITVVDDTDTVHAAILDAFASTSPIAAADWRLVLSPQTTIDVTDSRVEVGQSVTLTAGAAAFRATDLGKWVTLFGGLVEIRVVTNTTTVSGVIRSKLKDITTANPDPTRNWTIEVTAWSDALGYPTCGCFYQGRFWLFDGLNVNGSVTEDFENFAKGADDDAAIRRTISDDDVDAIVWAKGDQDLKIGTFSGVYQAGPTTQSGALTPTSFKVIPIDANGGARIQPLRVSPVLIFVDVNKRELRQLAYDFASDKFQSQHLFRLAEHLIDGYFINEIAYAASPDATIYAVRNDGVLLALVYDQVESVVAWYRRETDGEIKSVCVIPRPSTGKDWVWIIVERDGGTYVEYFEPDNPNTGREWNELRTDSAIVTQPDNDGVVSGLDHLEGKTVWIVGDGQLFNTGRDENGQIVSTAVVAGGGVTIENTDPPIDINRVEVGLEIDARIVPVEPMIPASAGGPLIARGYAKIGIRVRRALGLTLRAFRVNLEEPGDDALIGEQLVYRKPYHSMDRPVPLQQGTKCVTSFGYDPFARIEIRQPLPFPAEVLNVFGQLHVGDQWDCDTYNDAVVFTPIGFVSKECDLGCPLGGFVEATYNGATVPSGPALRVTSDSGPFAFTGLVALYVQATGQVALVLYAGEALAALATVVAVVSQVLAPGDVLRLQADNMDPEIYRVSVNGTVIIEETVTEEQLDPDNDCLGFVKVPNVEALAA
jgi:hypothetical protein